ncbi:MULTISPECIES: hypothetical protein [unclassified Kitasatospora]|nr:hypothetical protein [Kitasatospora sp. MAA19]MDH6705489.1 hypothetical protein [Kitasatospora sp. MAA19]
MRPATTALDALVYDSRTGQLADRLEARVALTSPALEHSTC